jgi:tetratricopeptide (TPR) repeat protein
MRRLAILVAVLLALSSCSTAPKERISPVKADADNLYRLGKSLLFQGKDNDAESSFALARRYYSKIDDVEGIVNTELAILSLQVKRGELKNYSTKVEHIREYISLFKPELMDRLLLAEVENVFMQKNYDQVLKQTVKGASFDKRVSVQLHVYRLLSLLELEEDGTSEIKSLRDYLGSIKKQTKGIIFEAELYSFVSYTLGYYYYHLFDYKRSENYFLKALEADKSIDNTVGIGKDLYYLGLIRIESEDLPSARHYFLRAKEIFEAIKDLKQVQLIDSKLEKISDLIEEE